MECAPLIDRAQHSVCFGQRKDVLKTRAFMNEISVQNIQSVRPHRYPTTTDENIYAHLNCLSVYETHYFGNMCAAKSGWPENLKKTDNNGSTRPFMLVCKKRVSLSG